MAGTLLWLRELASFRPAPEDVGGKARHLALLCAAGLPVPDGFVLPTPAVRALHTAGAGGDDARAAMRAAAARLGPRLVVRSSSAIEDRAEGAAPGLFSSRLDIRPEDLDRAVREVLASADGPAVREYVKRRGLGAAPGGIAVIVQRQVGAASGSDSGVLYTRAAGGGDPVCVEAAAGGGLASTATVRRDGAVIARDPDFPLSAGELAELVGLGLAAEAAIDAEQPGADVEWVVEAARDGETARTPWLVQARPIRTAPRAAAPARPELAFSAGDPHTVWRWDASHNPDPLSPAQIGLVEWVAAVAPSPMRVVDGYLYVGSRPHAGRRAAPTAAELEALFAAVRADIVAALHPVESKQPDLEAALAAYRAVYEAYMVRLAPALSAARAALDQRDISPQLQESAVARAARSGDRDALAALAPVWDVAAATFEEDGAAVDRAVAKLRLEHASAADPPDAAHLARVVRTIGEADDMLFFRAQRAVRRALLGLSRSWGLTPPDDIFFLPLDQVRAANAGAEAISAAGARRIARRARDTREQQRARAAPLAFRDGRPIAAVGGGGLGLDYWRGRSAGPGSARGRALRVVDLGRIHDDPHGRVIVAQAITPAALIQLAGAAALVCEQGGVLDHAAALARELALPCVVGCQGVWRAVGERDDVLVDGDAGLVVRLGEGG